MVTHILETGGNRIRDISWVSECCDSIPIGELDISTVSYGGTEYYRVGFCSTCKDNCIFVVEDTGEPEDHFDTKEEKYGER